MCVFPIFVFAVVGGVAYLQAEVNTKIEMLREEITYFLKGITIFTWLNATPLLVATMYFTIMVINTTALIELHFYLIYLIYPLQMGSMLYM